MDFGLCLFLLAVAVYLNCLGNDFTYDDFRFIAENDDIHQGFWRILFTPYTEIGLYRPVIFWSYAANYALGGLHPFGFHLFNVLAHASTVVLFYKLLLKLLNRPPAPALGAWSSGPGPGLAAFAAAALFAVHPIHTEAVANAVGRIDLLSTGFVFAAWLLHEHGWGWLAALCFLLALLSKESAAAFLVLVPLVDYAGGRKRKLSVYSLYAMAFALYLALRWKVVGAFGLRGAFFVDNPLAPLPAVWRIANALRVAWKYVALQLYPARLSADYSYNAIPAILSWKPLLPAIVATAAVLAAWIWSFRRHYPLFLAGSIYLAGFALTSNVLFPIATIMGERLAYWPSAGLCLLAGVGWEWLAVAAKGTSLDVPAAAAKGPRHAGTGASLDVAAHARKASLALLALGIVALSARTVVRNRDWQDNFTLFSSAVQVAPGSARAHLSLGEAYLKRRDLQRAGQEFDQAYRIYPYLAILQDMALLRLMEGDVTRAEQFMQTALRISAGNPDYGLLTTYAALLVQTGRYDAALNLLDRVIAASPRLARAYSNRAVLHYYRREFDLARNDARTALRFNPTNEQASNLLRRLRPQ